MQVILPNEQIQQIQLLLSNLIKREIDSCQETVLKAPI